MARGLTLTPVASKRTRGSSRARTYTVKFPKVGRSRSAGRASLRRWVAAQPVPKAPKNPAVRIKAVKPTKAVFTRLRAVSRSASSTEVISQRFTQETFLGTLYSALATYELIQLEAEYKRRQTTGAGNVDSEWANVQKAAQTAFSAAGLRGVAPADLTRFSQTLRSNAANRDAVIKIANTGRAERGRARTRGLTPGLVLTGAFEPIATKLIDRFGDVLTPISVLCSQPLTQGSFTKHFGSSVSLSVTMTVWCPTWTDPFRTCQKTFTLAGVSWAVDVNVGYKVTCCGVTVWGSATVAACATIIGISVCASCTASIVGVAGVSRTPVGSGCQYGLGISASLTCSLFGATIFTASAPFGWTISGPCPPKGICP